MKTSLTILFSVLCFQLSTAQLQNLDFEQWNIDQTSGSPIKPTGWFDNENPICYQDSLAFEGDFALGVSVWYWYSKTTAFQTAPISSRPLVLSGFYKYTENFVQFLETGEIVDDTALVEVYLTAWNNTLARRDTVGSGKLPLFESVEYSEFNCFINYISNDLPDTIQVILDPSIMRRYLMNSGFFATTESGRCSFLTIDNLSLSDDLTGISAINDNSDLIVFPNPAQTKIQLGLNDNQQFSVEIFDSFGKCVHRSELGIPNSIIPIETFSSGVYFVRAIGVNGAKKITRFVKS